MELDFNAALQRLGAGFAVRIANGARTPDRYLFARYLPPRNRETYNVDTANMRIVPTMAGLVGMDSPYPPVGQATLETFLKESAKIAGRLVLSEKQLRELQQLVMRLAARGEATVDAIANELIGLTRVALQALMDREEWLRGQALLNGEIDWSFNGTALKVDYMIPDSQFIDTATGTDVYGEGGTSSTFWADLVAGFRAVSYNVQDVVIHVDTFMEILGNDVNKIEVLEQTGNVFRIRRLVGNNERPSTDARYTTTITTYAGEGSVFDPASPGATKPIKFMETKKILIVGRGEAPGYQVGRGAQVDPQDTLELGYTHVAPTVEGGGIPGRWLDTYVPKDEPWQVVGRGVENVLPVIEAKKKLAVLSTD